MPAPTDPYPNFVNGTTADADQVDARFAPLYAATAELFAPAVATVLPAGVNGQQLLFQNAAMKTDGIGPWLLRYDASVVGAYKWGVVGATPWSAGDQADYTPLTTYTAVGPSITAPLAGDYRVSFGYNRVLNVGVATSGGKFCARHGATMPVDDTNAIVVIFEPPHYPGAGGNTGATQTGAARSFSMRGVVAGEAISCAARYDNGGAQMTYRAPWFEIVPLRVG